MCKHRTLKQLLYLISFFICATMIASLTLVLKILTLCGCFRRRADADPPDYAPISAPGPLSGISP
jgi:hypothetical protein